MDSEVIYVLSSLGGIAICCFCTLIILKCCNIYNDKNIEKNVIEPVEVYISTRPNYQITKEYMPQDAVTTSIAGTK